VVAGAAFAAAGPVIGMISGIAAADPPPRTAQQLLVDIQQANLKALSGTVEESANLGLPALPTGLLSGGGAGGGFDPVTLLTGTNTLRVWANGPDKGRVALLSSYSESDLIRNGSDVWAWDSSTHQATHWTLPDRASSPGHVSPGNSGPGDPSAPSAPAPDQAPLTPQQLADQALAAIDSTTTVTADQTTTVAGRAAYLLTLTPNSADTLIGSVQIAIDADTHIPTRVQIFAKGQSKPGLSVGFTQFDPSAPPDSVFAFAPGSGVTVVPGQAPGAGNSAGTGPGADSSGSGDSSGNPAGRPAVVGSGWESVLIAAASDISIPGVLPPSGPGVAPPSGPSGPSAPSVPVPGGVNRRVPSPTAPIPGSPDPAGGLAYAQGPNPLGALLGKLPQVSGPWGSGRLLAGTLFSAVLTDDGRIAIGAVPPEQLYAALG
jgi:outer membrane lipoprotein-sorting protein